MMLLSVFLTSALAFSEECVQIADYTVAQSHTILCSKLYHGIFAIPLSNPVPKLPTQPCSVPCKDFNQCDLVTACIDGIDGLCVFNNGHLQSGAAGRSCPGSGFSMYYICLPLKPFVKDVCFGLPGKYCYSDDFRTSATKKWLLVPQTACTGACQLDQTSPSNVYKDKLVFNARHVSGAWPPRPALAMVISNPNAPGWRNYEVTANFRLSRTNPQDFDQFVAENNMMVGVIVRQSGNPVFGVHYLAAWSSSTDGVQSQIGIFEWTGSSYRQMATGTTAPLPANFWFSMIVRVENNLIRVYTNKSPLGEPTKQCSMRVNTTVDPVNCNGNQLAVEATMTPTVDNQRGTAGLYFAGSFGYSDDLYVRRLPSVGTCGRGGCEEEEGEDCINCPQDCVAPCGCGDGICAGDMEALGCPEDCLTKCQVMYFNKAKREWFYREDFVAAYYSFDNTSNLGFDDSNNGVNLIVTSANNALTTGCAPNDPTSPRQSFGSKPGCLRTQQYLPLLLRDESSAWGRLPVASCDFTVAAFLRMEEASMGSQQAYLIKWGDDARTRNGLAAMVNLDFGVTGFGGDGSVTFIVGLHNHKVPVNWSKPGLRHIVAVYRGRGDLISTEIFVDQVSMGVKTPCNMMQRQAAQMVTFGKLEVASFPGIIDDLKIIAKAWTSAQVSADFAGSGNSVQTPPGIFATGMPGATQPDFQGVQTFDMQYTTSARPTPATTLTDPTHGPMWDRQTAPVKTCRDLCAEKCGAATWTLCRCASEFAVPTDFICPAARATFNGLLALALLALVLVSTVA